MEVYAIDLFSEFDSYECFQKFVDSGYNYYLPGNSPLFESSKAAVRQMKEKFLQADENNNTNIDFDLLPFLPVDSLSMNTLSGDAQHHWQYVQTNGEVEELGFIYHFDMHQIYGS